MAHATWILPITRREDLSPLWSPSPDKPKGFLTNPSSSFLLPPSSLEQHFYSLKGKLQRERSKYIGVTFSPKRSLSLWAPVTVNMKGFEAPWIAEEMINSSQHLSSGAWSPELSWSQTPPKPARLLLKAEEWWKDPSPLVTEIVGSSNRQPFTRTQFPHLSPFPASAGGANSWSKGRQRRKLRA